MVRAVRWYFLGCVAAGLGLLAGCSGGSYFAEREPWRHEAEAKCLGAGAVKEGAGVVRVKPISGPGTCGADFPLRVSALSQSTALGFGDELRPPGGIPRGSADMPRWPVAEPRYVPPYEAPYEPRAVPPPQSYDPPATYDPRVVRQPLRGPRPEPAATYGLPLSLDPPPAANGQAIEPYDFRKPYGGAQPAARAPARVPAPAPRVVPLGPARAPATSAIAAVTVAPTATLACPIVSALDQWIAGAVQPAALHWFGQPVAEIRQISAYSCRGMNGNPRARISEHAFGNALDIASFTLADGRKVTVKGGWHGLPEEQGFLRDVQAAACEQFTTVLAPGSNAYHYDHIHVDLMRRRDGRHACNPRAVPGEEVAARARSQYEARHIGEASITGAIAARRMGQPQRLQASSYAPERTGRRLPLAEPGNDGEE
jgi:hypothetical protein